jgi:hypothetical protein
MDIQIDRRQIDGLTDRQRTDSRIYRQWNRQTNRQTDSIIGRRTDRQTHRKTVKKKRSFQRSYKTLKISNETF